MRRLSFVLAGLVLVAVQGWGPAQMGGRAGENYEVTAGLGPWLILLTSYTDTFADGEGAATKDGQEMAIKLVKELRSQYRLPAYIYNYTDPERKEEETRVRQLIDQQRKYLAQIGDLSTTATIHVRRRRFRDNYGVFVGGYASREAAEKEMKRIKKLPPPDPKRVALAHMGIFNPIKKGIEEAWSNPFKSAFVVPNPTVKREAPKGQHELDKVMVKRNEGEEYNLINCPKRYTLAVSEFHGLSCVEPPSTGSSILEKLHLKSGQSRDAAALNAHNVAGLLRKLNFQAYVIHMQYYSLVTVGCYDAPDDPGLKAVQQQIGKLKLDPLPMLSPPMPVEIPPELRKS
jgi:hypothetical protein